MLPHTVRRMDPATLAASKLAHRYVSSSRSDAAVTLAIVRLTGEIVDTARPLHVANSSGHRRLSLKLVPIRDVRQELTQRAGLLVDFAEL